MNEMTNIKTKAFSGMFWKLLERVSAQGVSLIVSIILARMLTPDDYSVVSVVSIFFVFCNVFISSGFNVALIQKKNADIIDYSSVLFVSIGIAIILYIVMFFASPVIARFFHEPLLVPAFRVMSIMFIITAYKGVVCAGVSKKLQFRKFFISTIVGTIISGVIGIVMAKNGFGVWALVVQQMSNAIIDSLVLTMTAKIKLKFVISFKRLKGLFSYGWKIFVASIIGTIYENVKPLIVGIRFETVDLAFYNKAEAFPKTINSAICDSIRAVLFPVMCKLQDDKESALNATRKFVGIASYVVFPLLVGFLVISDNFIQVVLTSKWLPASPYIKIFCISYLLNVVHSGHLQTIRALGKSDIILKLEMIKTAAYVVILSIFIMFAKTPYMLAVSGVLCSLIAGGINSFPNISLIGYTVRLQVVDLLPNFVISVLMGICVYFIGYIKMNTLLLLIIQIITGFFLYVILSIVMHNRNFEYILDYLIEKISQ